MQLQFNRFGIYHDGYGAFYPIRCAVDGRYKLAINLNDRDEFYDLENDPQEMTNLIDDPAYAGKEIATRLAAATYGRGTGPLARELLE